HVLVFAAVTSVLTAILFGLAPAIHATRVDLNSAVKKNTRIASGSRSRLGRSLLVLQVAASVVLLVGAGLLLRTLAKVPSIDVGFDTRDLLLFRAPTRDFDTQTRTEKYNDVQTAALYARLI